MMLYDCTISPEELRSILDHGDVTIIDCRFDLMHPQQGQIDYNAAHIPGAYYAHLDKDLASPVTSQTGRHPLPDQMAFARLLASWGVTLEKQIVVYDNTGGSIAARLWWLLRYFGINSVAVLDGGINQWVKLGMPVNCDKVEYESDTRLPELIPHPDMLVSTVEMEKIQASGQFLMIDARTPDRFEGKIEPIDAIAGHIPGAVNRFHGTNLNEAGLLKTKEELKLEFNNLINSFPLNKVVVYCGSGVTSCHHLLAMKKAGIEGVRLYAGSWSEWIRDPVRPISKF
jgi:thiosulfate/3-mercaptopyruvate sulfurtransferase